MKFILINTKFYIYMLSLLVLGLTYSCSAKNDSQNIEKARTEAVKSAKKLLENNHEKLMVVQNCILEAKAQQSHYIIIGDSVAAREYDTAFKNYIKENNDSLAKILF